MKNITYNDNLLEFDRFHILFLQEMRHYLLQLIV